MIKVAARDTKLIQEYDCVTTMKSDGFGEPIPRAPEPGGTRLQDRSRRSRLIEVSVVVVASLGLGASWYLGLFHKPSDAVIDPSADWPPKDEHPAFVATHLVGNDARGIRHTTLTNCWFDPSPVQPWNLPGLLTECMQVSGKRYLIAWEAAGWPVYFGHTNSLNGAQWVAAVEQTLRGEDLILISDEPGVVKVIPQDKLDEYRKAGFVKTGQMPRATSASIYDESANGSDQISRALLKAREEDKRVLLQFGSNPCVWCHKLHNLFESDKLIAKEIKRDYVVVMIDVNGNHNQDIVAKYGYPTRFGLPAIVILDAKGNKLLTERAAALGESDHYNPEKVMAFLKAWSTKE